MEPLAIQLSDASGVPYYRQIVDQVALLIRSGRLSPNARLPSVRDLAKQLLVSLITVRRSYADLEAQGFIVRRQGYGTYVSEKARKAPRAQALTEIRAMLSDVKEERIAVAVCGDREELLPVAGCLPLDPE